MFQSWFLQVCSLTHFSSSPSITWLRNINKKSKMWSVSWHRGCVLHLRWLPLHLAVFLSPSFFPPLIRTRDGTQQPEMQKYGSQSRNTIHLTWFLFSVNKDKDTQEEQSMFHSSPGNDTNKNTFSGQFLFLESASVSLCYAVCEWFEKATPNFVVKLSWANSQGTCESLSLNLTTETFNIMMGKADILTTTDGLWGKAEIPTDQRLGEV